MLKKITAGIIIVCCLGFTFLVRKGKKEHPKSQALMNAVMAELTETHYQPLLIDDAFSKQFFDAYLALADFEKRLITQEEFETLLSFETRIDDDLNNKTQDFFKACNEVFEQAVPRAKKYYKVWINSDLEVAEEGDWETEGRKRDYAKDADDLKKRWKKIIQYEINKSLLTLEQSAQKAINKPTIASLKSQAVEEVQATFDNLFEQLERQDELDRFNQYINAMLSLYGPHNSYLTPVAQENFDIEISRSLQGVGLGIEKKGTKVKVVEVIPGSPAWKSKAFEIGDILLKVQEPETPAVDVTGMIVRDILPLLRGEKGTEVSLTCQKQDGSIRQTTLRRDVVILEAGLAKSLLLKGKDKKATMGYIRLPRFYFSRGDQGRKCATDVRHEIEKLQTQNIEGLIIDLRDNRGGSLRETLEMIGLFIEAGPALQREAQDRSTKTFYDKDSTVLYKGELVILVNGFSGSASELFSGILQDYDRAVVVGSKSTFGKGTIQNLRSLDREDIIDSTFFPLGNLKMTVAKFYRVSGASTQLKGVTSDIVLPDMNSFIKVGEKAQAHPLPWTEIETLEYSQAVNRNPNLEQVKKNSAARVQKSQGFKGVLDKAKAKKERLDYSMVSLNYDKYKVAQNIARPNGGRANNRTKGLIEIQVNNLPQDKETIQSDIDRKQRNEEWIGKIRTDIYVEECVFILEDLLKK